MSGTGDVPVPPDQRRRQRRRLPNLPGPTLERLIVAILSASPVPLGAYHLLDELKKRHGLRNPMSVYRALDRLTQQSIVERVETASAYRMHDLDDPVLLACSSCGSTVARPAPDHRRQLIADAARIGFKVEHLVLELVGICAACLAGRFD